MRSCSAINIVFCKKNIAYCLLHSGKIITAGNGGSASQSQHFTSELMGKLHEKRTPYAARLL